MNCIRSISIPRLLGGYVQSSVTSRRAMLATLAGATLGGALHAASSGFRGLVCIRFAHAIDAESIFTGVDVSLTIQSRFSGIAYHLNPSLVNFERLFVQGSAAVLDEEPSVVDRQAFVQGGFAGPAWMLNAADVSTTGMGDRAFSFTSGLLALLPASVDGTALDNPSLLKAAASGSYAFPNTAIGRQLRQVAGLLASGQTQVLYVVSLGGPARVGDPAQQSAARLKQLDEAVAAFQAAVTEQGIGREVITFTSTDGFNSSSRHARLLIGGQVAGGEVYDVTGRERPGVSLAEWAGYNRNTILPGAVAPAARFLL